MRELSCVGVVQTSSGVEIVLFVRAVNQQNKSREQQLAVRSGISPAI